MGLSHTIAKERLFQPLRERLGGMDTWAGYLVCCPYCLSHWLAFVLVPLFGVRPLPLAVDWGIFSSVLDWFFSSILVTVLAAFMRVLFWFVDEAQALTRKKKAHEALHTRREEDGEFEPQDDRAGSLRAGEEEEVRGSRRGPHH